MSNYEAHRAAVRRERETEQRIRQMDAPDIVEEIHGLEDALRELEAELKAKTKAASRALATMQEAVDKAEAQRDRQAAWAAYYRSQWLGKEAAPPAPVPEDRAALEGKG